MNKARSVLVVLVAGLVVSMGGCTGLLLSRFLSTAPARYANLNTATLVTQVQGLAQLVSVKYVMEKVVMLEDVNLFGENRILLVAHGVVKAGVDLSKLQSGDVEIHGQKIVLRLPMATITDCYLDENQTQVVVESTGLLRRYDKDLQQNARREGLDAIRRAARYSGIVDDANQRAQLQAKAFLRTLGFEEVEFRN